MYQSLKISKINQETSDAVSIVFEVPASLLATYKFLPGQFLGVKKEINGKEVRRSYSICSSSKSGELMVAIKKVEGGLFSTYAVEQLKVGDYLDVAAPEGRFTISCLSNHERNYVFVAAGSGITPIMGMIKSILVEEPLSKVLLIYGNQSAQSTIFKNELAHLQQVYSDRLRVSFVYSKEKVEGANYGRIDGNLVSNEIEKGFGNAPVYGVYTCGPEQMITSVGDFLQKNKGFSKEQIHFELFHLVKDENKLIKTDFEKSKVTVTVDDVDYTFEVKAGSDILSAGLDAGIDIPYSCQGGVCGTCECTVKEGEVELAQNMVLSDDEVSDGQALACQAIPKTAEVKLYFGY